GSEASLSKNPCQIAGQNGSSGIKENKSERRRSFPTPNRQLFQVHGSKLKLDPSCDAGQASVVGITHGVFFVCVGEDPLDRYLADGIYSLGKVGFADRLSNVQEFLPDVALEYFLALFTCTALFPARAAAAGFWHAAVEPFSIPVCCGVPQAVA